MKIGILIWELNIQGGTQRQALELAVQLQNLNHEIVVYTYAYDYANCYPELCKSLMIRSVTNDRIGTQPKGIPGKWSSIFKYVKFYFQIEQRELLDYLDEDLDILNPHDYRCYVTAGLWKQSVGGAVVWCMNDPPLRAFDSANLLKTIAYYARPKFRRYIRSFDEIIVLDTMNKDLCRRDFGKPARIVHSGIDYKSFAGSRSPDGTIFRLLSVGIFLPHRRVEDTLTAMSILVRRGYDLELDYVGSEEKDRHYAERMRSLARRLGLSERVRFHGVVCEDHLRQLYSNSDAFVFPNAPQTWGLSVFEAMSTGLPVVMTTGCGASEVLENGRQALITEPRDPQAIASAIEALMNDPSLRRQLSEDGKRFAATELSWQKYAESMAGVFSEIIENRVDAPIHGTKKHVREHE